MSQQAGWYDDPQDPDNLRYWDGVQWTSHTSPKQKPGLDRAGQSQQQWGAAPGQGGQEQTGHRQHGWGPQSGHGQQRGADRGNPYAAQQQGQRGYDQQGYDQQGDGQPGYGQPAHGQWGGGPVPGAYPGAPQGGRTTTPDGQPLAGWWHRVLARLIDGVLWLVVGLVVVVPLVAPTFGENMSTWMDEMMSAAQTGSTVAPAMPAGLESDLFRISMTALVLGLIYEIAMVHLVGGTVGKLVTGLRVRLREAPGNPALGPAALRGAVYTLLPQIPYLGWIASLLNYLWPVWDSKRQALHDKAARTNVVRKQRG